MEKGHAVSVADMLDFALKERVDRAKKFSFLDVGCGNGWVVRKVLENTLCNRAVGVDGAKQMIINAESNGGNGHYVLANLNSYESEEKFDLIHSMEVLYYLENPAETIYKINKSWLKPGGRLIVGIDHYYENKTSHSWQDKVGTPMLMLKEKEWLNIFKDSGLSAVDCWRSNGSNDWAGTLVLTGIKK
jgi:trans-aconitate methyltransferase